MCAAAACEITVGPQTMPAEVRVAGEVDVSNVHLLEEALAAGIACRGDVRIDLRSLAFMDVAGAKVLLRARWRLATRGQRLEIRGARANVRRLLDLVGLLEPDQRES